MTSNSNVIIIILVIVIIIALVYYLGSSNNNPIPNNGTLENYNPYQDTVTPRSLNSNPDLEMNGVIDSIISEYNMDNSGQGTGTFTPNDPLEGNYAQFNDYIKKKQINTVKMDKPFAPDTENISDFSYKKRRYRLQDPEEIKDQFDINQMLPQEENESWFDAEPLMSTQKINGSNFIDNRMHMGTLTIGTNNKNATHDIRGEPPVPKMIISPFNNSSIEPNLTGGGLC